MHGYIVLTHDFLVLHACTGGELTLVPVANLTLDPASPHANIEFLGGYNLVALFPG